MAIFHKARPGRTITQLDVVSIWNPAYLKGASSMNAISGFRVTGIWPYKRNLFRDCDYGPISETDQPQIETQYTSDTNTLQPSTGIVQSTHRVTSEITDPQLVHTAVSSTPLQ